MWRRDQGCRLLPNHPKVGRIMNYWTDNASSSDSGAHSKTTSKGSVSKLPDVLFINHKQETPDPWNQNLLLLCTMWEENFRPGKCLIYFLWGNRLNYVSISIRYKYKCEVSQYRIDFSLTMNLHSSVFLNWQQLLLMSGQVLKSDLVRLMSCN